MKLSSNFSEFYGDYYYKVEDVRKAVRELKEKYKKANMYSYTTEEDVMNLIDMIFGDKLTEDLKE